MNFFILDYPTQSTLRVVSCLCVLVANDFFRLRRKLLYCLVNIK
jgi:hypothetical protein